MLTNEILSSIDNIDECVMEAEMNVISAMINEYDKAIMIMENYNGNDYSSFDIFMEDGEQKPKKENIFKRIFKVITDLFQKFINICRHKIKYYKFDKIISKIKKSMSKEELDEFIQHFGNGNEKIKFENGDIIITSNININGLEKAIDKFVVDSLNGNDNYLNKVFRPSEYSLIRYIKLVDALCSRIEYEVIKPLKNGTKQPNVDSDTVESYSSESIKTALNRWNKVFTEISNELTTLKNFNDKIIEYMGNAYTPNDENLPRAVQSTLDHIKNGDISIIRVILKNSMLSDPSFKEFYTIKKLASNMKGLYEEHEYFQPFEKDRSKWNIHYMNVQLNDLMYNFSHERINHCLEIITYLRSKGKL